MATDDRMLRVFKDISKQLTEINKNLGKLVKLRENEAMRVVQETRSSSKETITLKNTFDEEE